MDVRPFDRSIPEYLLFALTVTIVGAMIVGAATSGVAFGMYTFTWEGTSELRTIASDTDTERIVATDPERYDRVEANGTVALVLSPSDPYDEADAQRMREFVDAGGTLVVADAFGPHGNELLESLGATARIDGDPLRDEQNYYRSPSLPIATTASEHPFVEGTDRLTLNHGSAIEPGEAEVLVTTSNFAYLDRNRNEELDEDETMAEYPVMTVESVGDGSIVIVSDPSVFINAMLERPGNRAFVEGLFAEHDRVLFDTSHTTDLPPLTGLLLAVRESMLSQAALSIAVVLGIGTLHRWSTVIDAVRRRDRTTDREPLEDADSGGGGNPGYAGDASDQGEVSAGNDSGDPGEADAGSDSGDPEDLRQQLEHRHTELDPERRERIVDTSNDDDQTHDTTRTER